jgi:hypothetical protein
VVVEVAAIVLLVKPAAQVAVEAIAEEAQLQVKDISVGSHLQA